MDTITGEYTTATLTSDAIDEAAREQIQTMVDHEAFQNDVVIMPDAHYGSGAVIGFTMELGDRVVPNTIGVDIGCGMSAVNLGTLHDCSVGDALDERIRDRIPMGRDVYETPVEFRLSELVTGGDDPMEQFQHSYPWDEAETTYQAFEIAYGDLTGTERHSLRHDIQYDLEYFKRLCERVDYDPLRAARSMGTLGGGNHFIELNESTESGNIWAVVHSGSRGLGFHIAQHHQERAQQLRAATEVREFYELMDVGKTQYLKFDPMRVSDATLVDWINGVHGEEVNWDRLKEDYGDDDPSQIGLIGEKLKGAHQVLEDVTGDLAYLEGEEAHQYFKDMIFAQHYASRSRRIMLEHVKDAIGGHSRNPHIESRHNVIDFNDLTIRKGATRAKAGDLAIVPLNMADGTLLIEGKGNDDWNRSLPHGAGRVMSRREAKRTVDLEDFEDSMQGVVSSSVSADTIDESPFAYKDASVIEDAIGPSGEIVERLVPLLNIKADD